MGHFGGNLLLSPNLEPKTHHFKDFKDLGPIFVPFQNTIMIPKYNNKKKEKVFPTLSWILDHLWKDSETLGLWLNLHKATRIN